MSSDGEEASCSSVEHLCVDGNRLGLDGPGLPKLSRLDVLEIRKAWFEKPWFKRLVAKAILYRAVEKKIPAMQFPAYGAQITAYVVSSLAQKTGGRIDFERLWSRQSVSAELEKLVEIWAPQIDTLLRQSAGQRNPSEVHVVLSEYADTSSDRLSPRASLQFAILILKFAIGRICNCKLGIANFKLQIRAWE